MVCDRCIMAVQEIADKMHLHTMRVSLGELEIQEDLSENQITALREHLHQWGFEWINDKRQKQIEQIKKIIIQSIYHPHDNNLNLSEILSKQLHVDYSYLSNLFTESEGVTIEKYFICQKLERVKEMIQMQNLTFSEIAYQLNYSSISHLSKQFKNETGLTMSEYRNSQKWNRQQIDKIV